MSALGTDPWGVADEAAPGPANDPWGQVAPGNDAQSAFTEDHAREAVLGIAPGAQITSQARTPEHNAEVGGVPDSMHIAAQAADIVLPKGMTAKQMKEKLVQQGYPVTEFIDEGSHVHWGWGAKGAAGPGIDPWGEGAAEPSVISDVGPMTGSVFTDNHLAPTVPNGAPRPLAPGEYVKNPDGSWSSEITVTVQDPALNKGRPTILPSLWLVNGKPVRVSEDQAVQYAKQSGLPWPSYRKLEDAEEAASGRESMWQDMKPQDAAKVTSLWEMAGGAKKPTAGWWDVIKSAVTSTPARWEEMAGAILQGVGENLPGVEGGPGYTMSGEQIRQREDIRRQMKTSADVPGSPANIGKRIYDGAAADVKANMPNLDDSTAKRMVYQVTAGTIDILPVLAASVVTGDPLVGGAMMGVQAGASRYGEARASGRSADQATMDSAFSGIVNGTLGTLPLGAMMKPGQTFLAKTLKGAGTFGAISVLTEAFQTAYDKGLVTPDMTLRQAWDRISEAGIVGLFQGAFLGGGHAGLEAAVNRYQARTPKPQERVEPAPAAAAPAPQRPSPPPGVGPLEAEVRSALGLDRPGRAPAIDPWGQGEVAPEVTPAPPVEASAAEGPGIPRRALEPDVAITAAGREVPVEYAVVEAGHLIPSQTQEGNPNPAFPAELQPRDRSRAVSQAQIASIAQNINPRLLDRSVNASDGAPIVAPSGVVESGNGRSLAIQRAYAENLPSARAYRDYLAEKGYPVEGMEQPVLVRIRSDAMHPDDRQAFVREANQAGQLGYSATERAMSDAAALPDRALELFRGGEIEGVANREFVRSFMNSAMPTNEHAGMVDQHGGLSLDGARRVRAALLAKAYADPDLVGSVVENADSSIKAIGNALTDSAADWARMRGAANRGEIPPALDQTGKLLEAVKLVARARQDGRNVAEFVGQPDIFTGQAIDPDTEAWLRLMFRNTKDLTQPVGREKLAEALQFYAREAQKSQVGQNLLGDEPVSPRDVLSLAKARQYGRDDSGPGPSLSFGEDLRARRQDGDRSGFEGPEAGGSAEAPRPGAQGHQAALGQFGPAPEGETHFIVPKENERQGLAVEANAYLKRTGVDPATNPTGATAVLANWVLVRGRHFGFETLAAVLKDGKVSAVTDGMRGEVGFTDELRAAMRDPAQNIISVHNHPSSSAFSGGDLAALAFPGHAAMLVVGHDGQWHGATMAAEILPDANREKTGNLIKGVKAGAWRVTADYIDKFYDAKKLTANEAHQMHQTMQMLVLEQAGVINYMGPDGIPGRFAREAHDVIEKSAHAIREYIAAHPEGGLIPRGRTADNVHRPAQPLRLAKGIEGLLAKSSRNAEQPGGARRAQADAGQSRVPGAAPEQLRLLEDDKRYPDLIIQHNLSVENLMHADRMGGIPAPSLSITKADHASTNFGDITLIGPKEMADPKNGTKVFGADIYSPRYPEISYKLDAAALKKINAILKPYREAGEREIYGAEINRPDDLRGNKAFEKYVQAQNPGEKYPDYRPTAKALLEEGGAQERLFRGLTNQGNRSYQPHTLENVLKILKKDLRGGENFNYGVGSLRSHYTPEFKSVKAIKAASDRLMTEDNFEKVRKDIDDEFWGVARALEPYSYRGKEFGFGDAVINAMADAKKMGLRRALDEYQIKDVPDDVLRDAATFLEKLRHLPTEYFEAKILRGVGVQEFTAAVIPHDAPPQVRKMLERRGIHVSEYKRNDVQSRRAAIAAAAQEHGTMFEDENRYKEAPEDRGIFNGKPFWSGAYDTRDGEIIETHPFKRAEDSDFHHSYYFRPETLDAMSEGDAAFFWIDKDGKIQTEWRDAAPSREILDAIAKQIQIRPKSGMREDENRYEASRPPFYSALTGAIEQSKLTRAIIPGAEPSATQLAKAREAAAGGKMATKAQQKPPGWLFGAQGVPGDDQLSLFEDGRRYGEIPRHDRDILEKAARTGDWIGRYRALGATPDARIRSAIAGAYRAWSRSPSMVPLAVRDIFGRLGGGGGRGNGGGGGGLPEGFNDIPTGRPTETFKDKVRKAAAKVMDLVHDAAMLVTPMAEGTPEARATAKDFANMMRLARWHGNRMMEGLKKNFTTDQRRKMWEAADEESVLRQEGKPTAGRGLSTLAPEERRAVLEQQTDAQNVWNAAKDLGMVEGEGLPSYVPRMMVEMAGDGAHRLGSGEGDARSIPGIGRNVRTQTAQMKHRKYLTAEETEAAGSAKFDTEAQVVKDIQTLPLATMRLREAVAGRALINKIKELGQKTGEDTVVEGHEPAGSPHKWFTLDNPAFKTWRPKLIKNEETGKYEPAKDQNGDIVFQKVPIYVRGDFEGPLRAVLSQDNGRVYGALMDMKGRAMAAIMYSPLIHNAVEWGRALPAMPGKVATFRIYSEGNRAKNDPETMTQAIMHGLVPIGHRAGMQDITSIANAESVKAGRSWTAKILGAVPGLFSRGAKQAVYRAVDAMGDLWHNTLLWDRVGDLQMGLYVNFRDHLIKKGNSPDAAAYMAAHFANRYAGALPLESMSNMARKIANLALFSRTYTLGNIGALKDVVTGLPRDVLAQIARDGTIEQLKGVRSLAARKALSILTMDVALFYISYSILQSAVSYISGRQDLSEIENGYVGRLKGLLGKVTESPLELLNPFADMQALSATSENEPGRENRILVGYDHNGTAIYARNPAGKIGEEFKNWITSPLETAKAKFSTILRPTYQLLTNDAGFGRQVYDPHAKGFGGLIQNIGHVISLYLSNQIPLDSLKSAAALLKGEGQEIDTYKTIGPLAGVTFSKGAPGGPGVGELFELRRQQDARRAAAMPDIIQKIKRGDIAGARADMRKLGLSPGLQNYYVRVTQNPRLRLNTRSARELLRQATPEERARILQSTGAR